MSEDCGLVEPGVNRGCAWSYRNSGENSGGKSSSTEKGMGFMSDAEIIKEFLVESYENLDRLDQELIALEKEPANQDTLASIFRTIHTIKGTSGFLAFNQLEAVAHVGENLLARLRDGQLMLAPAITTGLLSMVDAIRQMLGSMSLAHCPDPNAFSRANYMRILQSWRVGTPPT